MAYDLTPLASYVRFYLTVVEQLRVAAENIQRTHGSVKAALEPFAEPLARVAAPALAAAVKDAPSVGAGLAALWRPDDADTLGGLTDVYEVVGRFSFQGVDDDNLARLQDVVSAARHAIVAQRGRLVDLARLPDQARACAARLAADEASRAEADLREKAAGFEPLAEAVAMRARQTLDATRGVAMPDLGDVETAADEYRRYVAKIDAVYQTCLPFLRKAVAALYVFARCDVAASWADTLPLARELTAELLTVPPANSEELSQARASLTALAAEEIQLGRAREEIGSALARLDGETAAALMKGNEIDAEIATATLVLEHAVAGEQAEAARQAIAALAQQKARRDERAAEAWQRHQQIEAALKVIDDELRTRTQETTDLEQQLAAVQKDEPVLFGKDEWRARVASVDGRIDGLRATYGQRYATMNQFRIELSSVSVEVQTEQVQVGLVDRQLGEMQARVAAQESALREIGQRLGASRPARPVSQAEALQAIGTLEESKLEVARRLERLKGEVRRQKEENVRVLMRFKQIGIERQQVQAMVENAQVAATQGREEALRQLAVQRKAAVERHAAEVLGTLERSLTSIGAALIEPAREAMMKASAARPEVAAGVLEGAEKVRPVVERLGREVEPDLLAQDATLGQIQREFCDVAAGACRGAWG